MIKAMKFLDGTLLCPLAVGSRAVFLHRGNLVRTSRVVAIHGVTEEEARFETLNTTYRLTTGPSCGPAASMLDLAAAA